MSQSDREVIPDSKLDKVTREAKEGLESRLPVGFCVEAIRNYEAECPDIILDVVRVNGGGCANR